MKYSLGIDTSNYKTSIALTNIDGDIVYDKRILLNVDKGKRGLRQQEALFQHINNLPILFDDMFRNFDACDIACVAKEHIWLIHASISSWSITGKCTC